MSLRDDAIETVVIVAVSGLALWWIERKVSSGLSSVGDVISGAIGNAGQGFVDIASTFSPIVEPTAGQVPSVVDTVQAGLAPGQTATTGAYNYEALLMGLGN